MNDETHFLVSSFSNYAKVSSRQRATSQESHVAPTVTGDRKSKRGQESDDDDDEYGVGSGSKSVIVSEGVSLSKVSSGCNVCRPMPPDDTGAADVLTTAPTGSGPAVTGPSTDAGTAGGATDAGATGGATGGAT